MKKYFVIAMALAIVTASVAFTGKHRTTTFSTHYFQFTEDQTSEVYTIGNWRDLGTSPSGPSCDQSDVIPCIVALPVSANEQPLDVLQDFLVDNSNLNDLMSDPAIYATKDVAP